MKVLLQNRGDAEARPGGDTMQVLELKRWLSAWGVEAHTSYESAPSLRGYDLVHLINLDYARETFLQSRNAQRQGVPVVLSPIYHELNDYYDKGLPFPGSVVRKFSRGHFFEVVRDTAKVALGLQSVRALWATVSYSVPEMQQRIVEGSALILPNSEMEAEVLRRRFAPTGMMRVVHLGVQLSDVHNVSAPPRAVPSGDFLVCIGRIEPRKNQLHLLTALRNTGIPVVLVGRKSSSFPGYSRRVLRELARGGGVWIPEVSHSEAMAILQRAKVHAMPSWFETCSLVSVEAQAMGCNVVCTNRGYAREYLGAGAWYCDPVDQQSIREACLKAWAAPKPAPREPSFTWETAAQRTLEAYEELLSQRNAPAG